MERLTEWKYGKKLLAKTKFSGDFGSANVLNRLAEYEDLEEQGLLLRLPCKVGSTLYQPISNRQINEYKVIGLCFDITRNEFMYEVAYQIGLEWYKTTCDFDRINKTVFLTKEEAEQKLKEMESNQDGKVN